jgi:hypothetical protein
MDDIFSQVVAEIWDWEEAVIELFSLQTLEANTEGTQPSILILEARRNALISMKPAIFGVQESSYCKVVSYAAAAAIELQQCEPSF